MCIRRGGGSEVTACTGTVPGCDSMSCSLPSLGKMLVRIDPSSVGQLIGSFVGDIGFGQKGKKSNCLLSYV